MAVLVALCLALPARAEDPPVPHIGPVPVYRVMPVEVATVLDDGSPEADEELAALLAAGFVEMGRVPLNYGHWELVTLERPDIEQLINQLLTYQLSHWELVAHDGTLGVWLALDDADDWTALWGEAIRLRRQQQQEEAMP